MKKLYNGIEAEALEEVIRFISLMPDDQSKQVIQAIIDETYDPEHNPGFDLPEGKEQNCCEHHIYIPAQALIKMLNNYNPEEPIPISPELFLQLR